MLYERAVTTTAVCKTPPVIVKLEESDPGTMDSVPPVKEFGGDVVTVIVPTVVPIGEAAVTEVLLRAML
jgi:hypothetical protein